MLTNAIFVTAPRRALRLRPVRLLRLAAAAAAACCCAHGAPQPPPADAQDEDSLLPSRIHRFATMPELNELATRARRAVADGETRLAAELFDAVIKEGAGFMAETRQGIAIPVRRMAERMLTADGPEALPAYLELAEPRAAAALAALRPANDVPSLSALADRWFLTPSGALAAWRCAGIAMDRDKVPSALYWWRRLLDDHPNPPVARRELAVRVAAAAARTGREPDVQRVLTAWPDIEGHPALRAARRLPSRTGPADEPPAVTNAVWPFTAAPAGLLVRPADPEQVQGLPPTPCWQAVWRRRHDYKALLPRVVKAGSQQTVADMVDSLAYLLHASQQTLQWMPAGRAVADGATLYYRWANTLFAFSLADGHPRWSLPGAKTWVDDMYSHTSLHRSTHLHRLQFAMYTSGPVLYQLEDARTDPGGEQSVSAGGRLSAVDLKTGKRLWSFGGPAESSAGGDPLSCLAAPLVVDTTVFTAGIPKFNMILYALDSKDGTVRWTSMLGGRPVEHEQQVASLAADLRTSTLYAATPDGLLHAVDLGSGIKRWSASWWQTAHLREQLDRLAVNPGAALHAFRRRNRAARPPFFQGRECFVLPLEGGVFAMPADGALLAAFRGADGVLLNAHFLDLPGAWIGMAPDNDPIIATERSVLRFDLDTFDVLWETGVQPTGMGTVGGDTVFVPSFDRIERLDIVNGSSRGTARVFGCEDEPLGNLQVLGPHLLSVGANTIALLENTARTLTALRARIAAGPTFAARLRAAELLRDAGRATEAFAEARLALELADAAGDADTARNLVFETLLSCAAGPEGRRRLAEAATLCTTPEHRAALSLARADRAAAAQDWTGAVSNLVAAALQPADNLLTDPRCSDRATASIQVRRRLADWLQEDGDSVVRAVDAAAAAVDDDDDAPDPDRTARLAYALWNVPAGWRATRRHAAALETGANAAAAELTVLPWTQSDDPALAAAAWTTLAAFYKRQGRPGSAALAADHAADLARLPLDEARYRAQARARARRRDQTARIPPPPWTQRWIHALPPERFRATFPYLHTTFPLAGPENAVLVITATKTGSRLERVDTRQGTSCWVTATARMRPQPYTRLTTHGGGWAFPSLGPFMLGTHNGFSTVDLGSGRTTPIDKPDGVALHNCWPGADVLLKGLAPPAPHERMMFFDREAACRAADGTLLWERPCRPSWERKASHCGHRALVIDDTVTSRCSLLDTSTGRRMETAPSTHAMGDVLLSSDPVAVLSDTPLEQRWRHGILHRWRRKHKVRAHSRERVKIHALNTRTGRTLWRRELRGYAGLHAYPVTANLLVARAIPYRGPRPGNQPPEESRFFVIDPMTGRTLAEFPHDRQWRLCDIDTCEDGTVLECVERSRLNPGTDKIQRLRYRRFDLAAADRMPTDVEIALTPDGPREGGTVGLLALNPGGDFLVVLDRDPRRGPVLSCRSKADGKPLYTMALPEAFRGGRRKVAFNTFDHAGDGRRFVLCSGQHVLALETSGTPETRR